MNLKTVLFIFLIVMVCVIDGVPTGPQGKDHNKLQGYSQQADNRSSCSCSCPETSRVTSKHLFNFRQVGVVDADILAHEMEHSDPEIQDNLDKVESMPEEQFAHFYRAYMDEYMNMNTSFKHPLYEEAARSCDHSTILIPTTHEGYHDLRVLVHTPKALSLQDSRPCIIYAHGGGIVGGSAEGYAGFLSHMAVNSGVVVFNVDYRLAPETRSPNNALDFYEAIKHVIKHSRELGIDPARIAIAGQSGGGTIIAAATVHLARQEEAHMVKLVMMVVPMLTDYSFGDPRDMTNQEAESVIIQQKLWRLIGGPQMESLKDDAMLYPGKADEKLLKKMPPTIVWSAEFDYYITEATRFAGRLREAGRLLEFVVIPGAKHESRVSPIFSVFKLETEAWRLAIQEYLIK